MAQSLRLCSFLKGSLPSEREGSWDSLNPPSLGGDPFQEKVTTKEERGLLGLLRPSLARERIPGLPLTLPRLVVSPFKKGSLPSERGPSGSPEVILCLVVTPFKAESLPSETDCSCELA